MTSWNLVPLECCCKVHVLFSETDLFSHLILPEMIMYLSHTTGFNDIINYHHDTYKVWLRSKPSNWYFLCFPSHKSAAINVG